MGVWCGATMRLQPNPLKTRARSRRQTRVRMPCHIPRQKKRKRYVRGEVYLLTRSLLMGVHIDATRSIIASGKTEEKRHQVKRRLEIICVRKWSRRPSKSIQGFHALTVSPPPQYSALMRPLAERFVSPLQVDWPPRQRQIRAATAASSPGKAKITWYVFTKWSTRDMLQSSRRRSPFPSAYFGPDPYLPHPRQLRHQSP